MESDVVVLVTKAISGLAWQGRAGHVMFMAVFEIMSVFGARLAVNPDSSEGR